MPEIEYIEERDVFSLLPRRAPDSHKGSFGSVVAVAGSLSYRGAAVLCVEGALRMGAGLVYLASVEPVVQTALARTPEVCVLPCRVSTKTGGIDPVNAATIRDLFAPRKAVLLAGPGLGEGAAQLLPPLLKKNAGWRAAVLDADALNALAANPRLGVPANTVLTPHPGEAARLLGWTAAQVQADRPRAAQALAEKYGCVAVLKGSGTLVATPEGELWLNTTGNPGLARGGSGDVLAGMLAALLAQGLIPEDAARCAVWLHGAAADRTAERLGQLTMLPQDIFADLGALLAEKEK